MVGAERRAGCGDRPGLSLHSTWTWGLLLLFLRRLSYRLRRAHENRRHAGMDPARRATITPGPHRRADTLTRPGRCSNRLIVGLAEFSRRHALVVALGGCCWRRFSAFMRSTHLERHHRHRPDVLQQPAMAAAVPTQFNKAFPQFHDLLVAVIDAREPEEADATAAALAAALAKDHAHFNSVRRPDASPVPAQGRAAVSRHEAADRPDGPHDRRATVPRPAGRGSDSARTVLRAVAARHGRHQGRRRPHALSRLARGIPSGAWPKRWRAIREPLSWQSLLGGNELNDLAGKYNFVLVQPKLDFGALQPGRRSDRGHARASSPIWIREVRRRARPHHRAGRTGRRGIRHCRARRGLGSDRQRAADHAVAVPCGADLAADPADPGDAGPWA